MNAPPAIPTSLVGRHVGPLTAAIGARWTMAYAAGIGDTDPRYIDTSRAGGIVAHPLFPVCAEWPVIVAAGSALPDLGLVGRSGAAGLHAAHDLTVHRLVRPDDTLATDLTVSGVTASRPGALVTVELRTTDAAGEPVATTRQDLLYLGATVTGPDAPPPASDLPGRPADVSLGRVATVVIEPGAAHVYTECARIWNPIHTDRAVAADRGLADLPLHGTATLARTISALVALCGDGDPAGVRRVAGRFRAIVPMPSVLTVLASDPVVDGDCVVRWFEVRTVAGEPAIDRGCLITSP